MTYCIWDTQLSKITQGPWDYVPKRIFWASGDTVSPGLAGQFNGDEMVVSIAISKDTPKYHRKTGWQDTFDGNEVTRVATSERVAWPDEDDVEEEFERRVSNLNITLRVQFEAFQDYLELKEIKDAGGTLTQAQQTRWNRIKTGWQTLKTLRQKSKDIKNLSPIPDDYDADARWS